MAVIVKLGGILVKQLSKPIASRLKARAQDNQTFRAICITLGRAINQVTTRVNVWAAGHQVLQVRPLTESKAVNRGAEVLSESVVFSVAGAVVIYEYWRSAKSSEAKSAEEKARKQVERKRAQERELFVDRQLEVLRMEVTALEERLRETERLHGIAEDDGAEYISLFDIERREAAAERARRKAEEAGRTAREEADRLKAALPTGVSYTIQVGGPAPATHAAQVDGAPSAPSPADPWAAVEWISSGLSGLLQGSPETATEQPPHR